MRVLLAYPSFPPDTFWSFDRALDLSGRSTTMPPLGLLTVAGMFPAERFEFSLADENVRPIRDAEIEAADLVLVSAMVAQMGSLERLVERCRSLGTPVVAGGPLVGGCFEELHGRGFDPDTWFIGEAERLLPALIEELEQGRLRRVYAHVAEEEKAARVRRLFGPDALVIVEPLPSLELAPVPRFDLLELPRYHSMAIQASRGCPIGCEFCDIWKQFGLKSRTGGAARLLDQLSYLFSLGWRGRVFVVDDNFIGNISAARSFLPALAEWQGSEKEFHIPEAYLPAFPRARLARLRKRFARRRREARPFAFSTEADVRLGDPAPKMTEIREAMVRAGFNSVFLGIETPSAESLREAGKQVNIGKHGDAASNLLERVKAIQKAGMEVMSGFIVGFDGDPDDIDRTMIEFIERSGIPVAMVGLLAVVPGTALQERLVREGRYRGRLTGNQTHDFVLDFIPKARPEREILDQYARILKAIYGDRLKSFYRRSERMMKTMPGPPCTGDRLGLRELKAFVLSLIHVRPRRSYWGFLARTLLRRPRFFGHAVVLGLQGDHFYRLTLDKAGAYERSRRHASKRSKAGERARSRGGRLETAF